MAMVDPRRHAARGQDSLISRRRLLQWAAPAFASAGFLAHPDIAVAQPTDAELRRAAVAKAIDWINDRDEGITTPRMIGTATENLKKALDLDVDTALFVGRNLMRSKRPHQLWVQSDGFFAFPMTVAQARMLNLKEDSMTTWTYPRNEILAPPFAAELTSLKLRDSIKNKEAITGTVKCRARDDARRDYHVKVTYRYDKWTTQHTRPLGEGGLPGNELVNFNFDASFSDAYVGPLAVFVSIVTLEGPNQAQIARSNTVGALMTVVPS